MEIIVLFDNFSLIWRRHHCGEGLGILTYARHSWPLSSEGSLACHTYCDTGHPFTCILVISEDLWYTHTPFADRLAVELSLPFLRLPPNLPYARPMLLPSVPHRRGPKTLILLIFIILATLGVKWVGYPLMASIQ